MLQLMRVMAANILELLGAILRQRNYHKVTLQQEQEHHLRLQLRQMRQLVLLHYL